MIKTILTLLCGLLWAQTMVAQVVFKEYLSKNHSGEIASVNVNEHQLYYEFVFVSEEVGIEYQSKEAIEKIHYKLNISDRKGFTRSYDVLIRDLIVSLYVEIDMNSGPEKNVVTTIYQKRNRWAKLKGIIPTDCKNQGFKWSRLDRISSFEQLLQFIIEDIDRNVLIACMP
jgi:hypothetical protein